LARWLFDDLDDIGDVYLMVERIEKTVSSLFILSLSFVGSIMVYCSLG